jgi:hypothetical protein
MSRERMRNFLFMVLLGLTGCGASSDRYNPPTVDTRNVDPARYNKDLADCTDEKRANGRIGDAGMISACMTRRGYIVTSPQT